MRYREISELLSYSVSPEGRRLPARSYVSAPSIGTYVKCFEKPRVLTDRPAVSGRRLLLSLWMLVSTAVLLFGCNAPNSGVIAESVESDTEIESPKSEVSSDGELKRVRLWTEGDDMLKDAVGRFAFPDQPEPQVTLMRWENGSVNVELSFTATSDENALPVSFGVTREDREQFHSQFREAYPGSSVQNDGMLVLALGGPAKEDESLREFRLEAFHRFELIVDGEVKVGMHRRLRSLTGYVTSEPTTIQNFEEAGGVKAMIAYPVERLLDRSAQPDLPSPTYESRSFFGLRVKPFIDAD